MSPSRPASLSIDTKNEKMLNSVSVGDTATFKVTGKVVGVQAPRTERYGKESETYPGHVTMEVSDVKKLGSQSKDVEDLDMMFEDEE